MTYTPPPITYFRSASTGEVREVTAPDYRSFLEEARESWIEITAEEAGAAPAVATTGGTDA